MVPLLTMGSGLKSAPMGIRAIAEEVMMTRLIVGNFSAASRSVVVPFTAGWR